MAKCTVAIKRAYEAPADGDGTRVLVDRIWPRGKKKEDVALEAWIKAVAPSNELRKWFGHDPDKWPEFRSRYLEELKEDERAAGLQELRELRDDSATLTLVFGAKNETQNNAVVLQEVLTSD